MSRTAITLKFKMRWFPDEVIGRPVQTSNFICAEAIVNLGRRK